MRYMVHDTESGEVYEGNLRVLIGDIQREYRIDAEEAEQRLSAATEQDPLPMNNERYEVWCEK